MARSRTWTPTGLRGLLLGVLALGALVIGPAAARADEAPPEISNAVVVPFEVPSTGGQVTVTATITDADGVGPVRVEATTSNGNFSSFNLTPVSVGSSDY